MLELQKTLRSQRNEAKALESMRFFKTAKGQYGYRDKFLGGWTTPALKLLAKEYQNLSQKEIKILLSSEFHEERFMGLQILVLQYKKSPEETVKFYLNNLEGINNWDLVDTSCYKILGDFCIQRKNIEPILKLSGSKKHWHNRISVVSTLAFIRAGDLDLTFLLAKKFLESKEDLMHKAVGWMLREAGKRGKEKLDLFIKQYGSQMPRTMLRYSIEKYPEIERKKILKHTKTA